MKTNAHNSTLMQAKRLTKATLFGVILFLPTLWNCRTNPVEPPSDVYQLDEKTSLVEWRGSQPSGNAHTGTLSVTSEGLTVQNGQVTGGTFTIPLSSLVDSDLPTDELKEQLIHHLQSADFFNIALYPALTYTITRVAPYTDGGPTAGANYLVSGQLTMLGQTHPVSFPARIQLGEELRVAASLTIDRTQWGLTYCADPDQAGDRYILPQLGIQLNLTAAKR